MKFNSPFVARDLNSDVEFSGFDEQVKTLEEILCVKIRDQKLQNIKGVLVHGPAGIGKTHAVATVLRNFSAMLNENSNNRVVEESKTKII